MEKTLRPVSVAFCKKKKKKVAGISTHPELEFTVLDEWLSIVGGLRKEQASILFNVVLYSRGDCQSFVERQRGAMTQIEAY